MIKNILLEAKTIDDEYTKDWSSIDRETFDKIIKLDPTTDIEKNKIGSGAKQFLLPQYIAGETDFVDNDAVTSSLSTYFANRASYPQILRNISNFPSVKDFVDYITLGDESDFAKSFDFDSTSETKKESKLDKIYNDYYSSIPREDFDKIIALDPETNNDKIGATAKNLLLAKALKGEDILDLDAQEIKDAIFKYNEEKDTYPEDKRNVQNFDSVKAFVDFVKTGPETEYIKTLKASDEVTEGRDYIIIGSTPRFDILRPLTHKGNRAIANNSDLDAPDNKYLVWCTGWNSSSQWNDHSAREYIYCFIDKSAPAPTSKDKKALSYQLAIRKSNSNVYQFLDGNDNAFGDFNAGEKKSTEFFDAFLKANPDVGLLLSKVEYVKDNPQVKEFAVKFKYADRPFIYSGPQSLKELEENDAIKDYIREVIVKDVDTIPAGAFSQFSALTKVTFPEGLKVIGEEAFMQDIALRTIEFPSTLETIKAEAFANCTALKGSVRLPDSVTSIGRAAFYGTHITLSINKNRTKKLNVDINDKAWYASHTKAITVQESLDLNEETLDENIPKDLALAYANSSMNNNRITGPGSLSSSHSELGVSANVRRGVHYDYKNSNYEQLSKDEAIHYLGLDGWSLKLDNEGQPVLNDSGKYEITKGRTNRELFNENIHKIRFLLWDRNNKLFLTEFDVGSGNRLACIYGGRVDTSSFGQYPLFDNDTSNDTRYLTKYSDFYILIQIAEKIYKTDEYEHFITSDTELPNSKIKISTPNPDNPDEVSTEIKTDKIVDRRNRNNQPVYLRKIRDNSDSDYTPHDFKGNMYQTFYHNAEQDTGNHRRREGGSVDYSPSYRNILRSYYDTLQQKTKYFKLYDYSRKALKKLESERDLYDEEEYNSTLQELKDEVKYNKENFDSACYSARKFKDKLSFGINDIIKKYNERWASNVNNLNTAINNAFNKSKELSAEILNVAVSKDNPLIKNFNKNLDKHKQKIEALNQEMKSLEEERQSILARLESIKTEVEKGQSDIKAQSDELDALLKQAEDLNKLAIKAKFDKVKALQDEQLELQNQIDTLAPITARARQARAAKNKEKSIHQDLTSIFDFSDTLADVGGETGTSSEVESSDEPLTPSDERPTEYDF